MSPPVIVCAHDKRLDDSRAHGHSELLWKPSRVRHSVSALRFPAHLEGRALPRS
jgi:hypothetical protein